MVAVVEIYQAVEVEVVLLVLEALAPA